MKGGSRQDADPGAIFNAGLQKEAAKAKAMVE